MKIKKILFSIFLIIKIGITGAAIATFSSHLFSIIFYNYFIKKKFNFNSTHNYYFLLIILFQLLFYYFFQNIFISFLLNNLILIIFIKKFKLFNTENIEIINDIDMPVILKKILNKIFKKLG